MGFSFFFHFTLFEIFKILETGQNKKKSNNGIQKYNQFFSEIQSTLRGNTQGRI